MPLILPKIRQVTPSQGTGKVANNTQTTKGKLPPILHVASSPVKLTNNTQPTKGKLPPIPVAPSQGTGKLANSIQPPKGKLPPIPVASSQDTGKLVNNTQPTKGKLPPIPVAPSQGTDITNEGGFYKPPYNIQPTQKALSQTVVDPLPLSKEESPIRRYGTEEQESDKPLPDEITNVQHPKKRANDWTLCNTLPPYNQLAIAQGPIADCYLLASMIGILSNPTAHAAILDQCEISHKKFTVTFQPDLLKISNSTFDLLKILSDKNNLHTLEEKGYTVKTKKKSTGKTAIRLTISDEKMRRIFKSTHNAATNSLLVNVMEHFVGNLILLQQKSTKNGESNQSGRPSSPLAHKNRGKDMLYTDVVCGLLGYRPSSNLYIYSVQPSKKEIDALYKRLEDYDQQQIGTAYANQKGFVSVSLDHKSSGRHAWTLHQVLRDTPNGQITGLKLFNPHGQLQTISLESILKKRVCLNLYTPSKS